MSFRVCRRHQKLFNIFSVFKFANFITIFEGRKLDSRLILFKFLTSYGCIYGFQGETGMEGSKGNKVFLDLCILYTLPVYISDTGQHSSKLGFFVFLHKITRVKWEILDHLVSLEIQDQR